MASGDHHHGEVETRIYVVSGAYAWSGTPSSAWRPVPGIMCTSPTARVMKVLLELGV
jgi:hypothetical protein